MTEDTVDTWTVQIVAEEEASLEGLARLRADLPAYMEEMQENLTDLLPRGYSARIKEWNSE